MSSWLRPAVAIGAAGAAAAVAWFMAQPSNEALYDDIPMHPIAALRPDEQKKLIADANFPPDFNFDAEEEALRKELEAVVLFYDINKEMAKKKLPPFNYANLKREAEDKFNSLPQKRLSFLQAFAIYLYTTDYFYFYLNRALRQGTQDEIDRWHTFSFLLCTGLHVLSTNNEAMPMQLIRDITLDQVSRSIHEADCRKSLADGAPLVLRGFMSTSALEGGAQAFKGNVRYLITCGNKTLAAAIFALSKYPKEGEWLVPYGAQVKVTAIDIQRETLVVSCTVTSLFDMLILSAMQPQIFAEVSAQCERRGDISRAKTMMSLAIKLGMARVRMRQGDGQELNLRFPEWRHHLARLNGMPS